MVDHCKLSDAERTVLNIVFDICWDEGIPKIPKRTRSRTSGKSAPKTVGNMFAELPSLNTQNHVQTREAKRYEPLENVVRHNLQRKARERRLAPPETSKQGNAINGSTQGHDQEEILATSSTTLHRKSKRKSAKHGQTHETSRGRPESPSPRSPSLTSTRRCKSHSGKFDRLSWIHHKKGTRQKEQESDCWRSPPCINCKLGKCKEGRTVHSIIQETFRTMVL